MCAALSHWVTVMSCFYCTGKNNTKKSKQIEQWIYHAAATLLTNMLQKWYGGSKISVTTQLRFNLSCWMAESWTILACTLAEARISFLSLLEIDTVRFGNLVNRIIRASPRLRQIESHLADQLWLCSPPAQDPSGSHFETFYLLFPPKPESYWISGISCFNTSWQQWLFAFTNFVSCTHCKGCTMMQTRGQGTSRWWKLGREFESGPTLMGWEETVTVGYSVCASVVFRPVKKFPGEGKVRLESMVGHASRRCAGGRRLCRITKYWCADVMWG